MSAPDPAGVGGALGDRTGFGARRGNGARRSSTSICMAPRRCKTTPWKRAVDPPVFGDHHVFVSSTKPFTGHALGAAGAIEAGLCWLAMQDDNPTGKLPAASMGWRSTILNCRCCSWRRLATRLGHPPRWALSNSFAFGGANVTSGFSTRLTWTLPDIRDLAAPLGTDGFARPAGRRR